METQKSYVPINCSKCGAQNNAARYTSCRLCGGHLEPHTQTARNTGPKSRSLRGFFMSALLLLLVAGGSVYFFYANFSRPASAAAKRPANRDVALPTASWHNKGWWSLVTKYPSAEEVFAKYREVNNDAAGPPATIAISGRFSQAQGLCYTQACRDNANNSFVDPATGYKLKVVKVKPVEGAPTPIPVSESPTRDAHESLRYAELGTVEISVKSPDKLLKKVATRPPGVSDVMEIVEVVSGSTGERSTSSRNTSGKVTNLGVSQMSDSETADARSELESLSKREFSEVKNARVAAVEKVNDTVVFVVTAQNKEGIEETYYFDTISGQIVKVDTTENAKNISIYFENFKPSPSGPFPSTVFYRQEEDEGHHSWIKFEVDKWEIGNPIDDSVFLLPGNAAL